MELQVFLTLGEVIGLEKILFVLKPVTSASHPEKHRERAEIRLQSRGRKTSQLKEKLDT